MIEHLYTVARVAEILGCSEKTVRRLIDQRLIDYVKFPTGDKGAIRIRASTVEQLITKSSVLAVR
jgi:excisionase family DNA binding protein